MKLSKAEKTELDGLRYDLWCSIILKQPFPAESRNRLDELEAKENS